MIQRSLPHLMNIYEHSGLQNDSQHTEKETAIRNIKEATIRFVVISILRHYH